MTRFGDMHAHFTCLLVFKEGFAFTGLGGKGSTFPFYLEISEAQTCERGKGMDEGAWEERGREHIL